MRRAELSSLDRSPHVSAVGTVDTLDSFCLYTDSSGCWPPGVNFSQEVNCRSSS